MVISFQNEEWVTLETVGELNVSSRTEVRFSNTEIRLLVPKRDSGVNITRRNGSELCRVCTKMFIITAYFPGPSPEQIGRVIS